MANNLLWSSLIVSCPLKETAFDLTPRHRHLQVYKCNQSFSTKESFEKDRKHEASSKVQSTETNLKRPILLRCENISPPGTNSNNIYKLELSYNLKHNASNFLLASSGFQRMCPLKGQGHITANKPVISMIYIVTHTWPLCSAQILVDGVNPK